MGGTGHLDGSDSSAINVRVIIQYAAGGNIERGILIGIPAIGYSHRGIVNRINGN